MARTTYAKPKKSYTTWPKSYLTGGKTKQKKDSSLSTQRQSRTEEAKLSVHG
jgi:hypothetical protein